MAFIEIKTDIKTYYVECLFLTIGENEINIFYNENLGENLLYIKKDNDYLYKF